MQPKHVCGRKYKNSIVNATWIADKLIDKFKVQLNMPLDVILDEVKDRWKVDVNTSCMYRARRKARKQIYGRFECQYERLWDYYETMRRTNRGSAVLMKVERPCLEVPPKFHRL
jgi:hypothetical protein